MLLCENIMQKFVRILTFLILFYGSFAQAEKLKVLIYNTWGVPIETWDHWRYEAAMKAIEELNPDVVVLSEVFTAKAKHKFKDSQYPYRVDGPGWFPRLLGSGTRILSKFPIDDHAKLTYNACKSSDCLSRKGANYGLITLPSGKKINIVGTHLNSAGGEETRISQLAQLVTFSDGYEDKSVPTIIAGDLNFGPQSDEYQYAVNHLNVTDSWVETHNASEPGYTYDCTTNHYAHDYIIKTHDTLFTDRIDYLFHRGDVKVISTQLVFNDADHLFSDHYGVLGEFEI